MVCRLLYPLFLLCRKFPADHLGVKHPDPEERVVAALAEEQMVESKVLLVEVVLVVFVLEKAALVVLVPVGEAGKLVNLLGASFVDLPAAGGCPVGFSTTQLLGLSLPVEFVPGQILLLL